MARKKKEQGTGQAQRVLRLPRLRWYQEPVVKALEDEKHKYITFLASRRIGKSLVAKAMAVKWCLNEKCNVGFVCPTGDLCRRFLKEIVSMCGDAVKGSNTVDRFILFCNGSMIYFHALEAFSRGAGGYKYLIFDEVAFMDAGIFDPVFKPWTLEAEKVYFCSTPCGPAGVFYDNYMRGMSGAGNPRYISFSCTLEESGAYPKEEIEEIKRTTPSAIYAQEYNCEFVSGGISAFKGFDKRMSKTPADPTPRLYAGIDFSGATGGIDSTVLCIVNEQCEMVLLRTWQDGNLATLQEMCSILNTHKVTMALAEENSMGGISIEILKKQYKRIAPFVTSNTSKREIVENVIRMFEAGKGQIIDTPMVRQQFSNFVMDRTPGGKITYHNQNKSVHDDVPISYCLACYCQKQGTRKGHYHLA